MVNGAAEPRHQRSLASRPLPDLPAPGTNVSCRVGCQRWNPTLMGLASSGARRRTDGDHPAGHSPLGDQSDVKVVGGVPSAWRIKANPCRVSRPIATRSMGGPRRTISE